MTEEQKTEQITKEPEEKIEKIKDPKKVAAGKRLAASNKKAREAATATDSSAAAANSTWLPTIDLNFSTVVGIVGIGLTAADLYLRYRKKDTTEKKESNYQPQQQPTAAPAATTKEKRVGME